MFEDLKDKHPDEVGRLNRLEKTLKLAELTIELQDNPAVKSLLAGLTSEVDEINSILLIDEGLTAEQRIKLFAERRCWQWLLDRFVIAKQDIESAEKLINKL